MVKYLFIFFVLLSQLFSQREAVISVLNDYIDGTANGEISRIKNAFESESSLYTINKDKSLKRLPSKAYVGFFKEGNKNNRKGQIVSLNVVHNAASAIVEIRMGARKYTAENNHKI